jgi:fumarate reductase flavoprotein subunit
MVTRRQCAARSAYEVAAAADFDAVVVGAGAAGCTAALRAAAAGLSIALLEQDASVPPTTALSGGLVFAARTRFQAAAGVDDSPAAFARDIQEANRGEADEALVLAICEVSRDVIHWLCDDVDYELELAPEAGRVDDAAAPLRAHVGRGGRGGDALMAALRARVRADERIVFGERNPCRGLLNDGGAVVGVFGDDDEIRAPAIVLACGGFGASRAMLKRYAPAAAGLDYIGGPGSTGEALEWARELGAAVAAMDSFQGHSQFVKGFGLRLSHGILGEGGIMVDRDGRRFAREDVNYSPFALDIAAQPGGEAVEIFDERILATVAKQDVMRVATAAGAYRRADTVQELAAVFSLDAATLHATLEEYATSCRSGSDRFGRRVLREPLAPPYYAARIVPVLAHTQGGLVVNTQGNVLREDGTAIPGLLAAGGTAVGLSGNGAGGYYSGHGLLSAFGGGWIAARTIASHRPG